MRGATWHRFVYESRRHISIHAPHARSDPQTPRLSLCWDEISIHAPHARSDSGVVEVCQMVLRFQSTLLMRGATWPRVSHDMLTIFQSTLLMRGATLAVGRGRAGTNNFNPRSSCEERRRCHVLNRERRDFNPRSSCEERQFDGIGCQHIILISIHAPHARSDAARQAPRQDP